ncbi:MAG: hypothetical protein GF418_14130 [Chitinivibrionales bacterium]|nr:hypothetical protein [Chitinivibrionales bacterium]MBD3396757.1 hypothetical protein [Chitinivibrionales bacterium]
MPSLLALVLLFAGMAHAVDLVRHSDTTKTYCRILRENDNSVRVHTDSGAIDIAVESITGITYSREDFSSPARIVYEGAGTVIRRGEDTLAADISWLDKGDVATAGPDRAAGILFVNGFQILLSPQSSVALLKAETDSDGHESLELELLEGSLVASLGAEDAEKSRVVMRSRDCVVSIREGICAIEPVPEQKVTAVDVFEGTVRVQVVGSEIGEVVVAENERVLASGFDRSVMEDYLPEEKGKELALVKPVFLRRTVGEVERPRVRLKKNDAFELLSERLVLRGHNGFWLVPSVSASLGPRSTDYSSTIFMRLNPRVHLGFNLKSLLSLSLTAQYYLNNMSEDLTESEDMPDVYIDRLSHQIILAPRASLMFLRTHFFATASAAWTNRLYIAETYNGENVEPLETYLNYFDADVRLGPVFKRTVLHTGLGMTLHSNGITGQAVAGFLVRILKGRILVGPEVSARLQNGDIGIVAGANLGSGVF